jgi:hypothetical protein
MVTVTVGQSSTGSIKNKYYEENKFLTAEEEERKIKEEAEKLEAERRGNTQTPSEVAARRLAAQPGATGGPRSQSLAGRLTFQGQQEREQQALLSEREGKIAKGKFRAEQAAETVENLPPEQRAILGTSEITQERLGEQILQPSDLLEVQKEKRKTVAKVAKQVLFGDLADLSGTSKEVIELGPGGVPNAAIKGITGKLFTVKGGLIGGSLLTASGSILARALGFTGPTNIGGKDIASIQKELGRYSGLSSSMLSAAQTDGADPFDTLIKLNQAVVDIDQAEANLKLAAKYNANFAFDQEYRDTVQQIKDARQNVQERIGGTITLIKFGAPQLSEEDQLYNMELLNQV